MNKTINKVSSDEFDHVFDMIMLRAELQKKTTKKKKKKILKKEKLYGGWK